MSIFSKIKNYFTPTPDLIHSKFGELVYDGVGNPDDLWQKLDDIEFKPTNRKIGLTVLAGPNGPNENHVQFYEEFEKNYSSILNKYSDALKIEYEQWFNKKPESDINKIFNFVALTIPEEGNKNNEWSISFYPIEDQEHLFTLYIKNGKPNGCSVDG